MINISEKLNLKLKKKALELDQLNNAVKISLPMDCRDHMEVADVRNKQLVILTDSPVWQTRLRMHSHSMLEALHQHTNLKLHNVSIRLIPAKRTIKEKPAVFRTLSEENSKLIEQTANCISDPNLQAALLVLSRKTKKPE